MSLSNVFHWLESEGNQKWRVWEREILLLMPEQGYEWASSAVQNDDGGNRILPRSGRKSILGAHTQEDLRRGSKVYRRERKGLCPGVWCLIQDGGPPPSVEEVQLLGHKPTPMPLRPRASRPRDAELLCVSFHHLHISHQGCCAWAWAGLEDC